MNSKKKNRLFSVMVLLWALTLCFGAVSTNAQAQGIDYNQKVKQVKFGVTDLNGVKAIFGEPQSVTENYIQYPDGFGFFMIDGTVFEIRFEWRDLGYTCYDGIRVGSYLYDVFAKVGYPSREVDGGPCNYEDGVLYKNIDGRQGYCYYGREDKHVRFFFSDYNICALYLTGQPMISGMEMKIDQLKFWYNLNQVISIFGEPQKYVWGNQEFTKAQLPVENYILVYDNFDFSIWMKWNSVQEVRFQKELGYSCYNGLKVGSTLDEVLANLGSPKEIVDGQACDYRDYVLYKNIDGRPGYCYYSRPDRHIRFFFLDFKINALYLTDKPVSEMNQKIVKHDFENADLAKMISLFGEPLKYMWGDQEFPKNNLPENYCAIYPQGFMIWMQQGRSHEVRFHSADLEYEWPYNSTGIWGGPIKVGSSLEEVINMVGQPIETVVGQACDYRDKVLYKDIDAQTGRCYYSRSDKNVRFFFWNYKVSALYLTGHPISPYMDVRWRNLAEFDFANKPDLIKSLWFNTENTWPDRDKLPANVDPKVILQNGMNPGLGVRALHQKGYTGQGVNVAIIDQELIRFDHPEFNGKIVEYFNLCPNNGSGGSMHGPAVASLLVGKNIGTAPGANLYFVAAPSWLGDAGYFAQALDWVVEKNKTLPASNKIRVVSISADPSYIEWFPKNQDLWKAAYARATAAGILVLDCSEEYGFIGKCYYDPNNPESVASCKPGSPNKPLVDPSVIRAPASYRTQAEHANWSLFGYQYTGPGGTSWSIPYVAGVLAMGWQIRPEMTGEQMKALLFSTAYVTPEGAKIINPPAFIQALLTYQVSGTVIYNGAPLANVVMSGLPGNPKTNASGQYTFGVTKGWTGTVTPTLSGYVFTPVNKAYANVAADQINQNYTAKSADGVTILNNGQTLSGLSASSRQWLYYKIKVPAGAKNLAVKTSGGTGDADLYLKFSAKPTSSSYQYRSAKSTNAETCTVASVSTEAYCFIGIYAYKAFSGLMLTVGYQ